MKGKVTLSSKTHLRMNLLFDSPVQAAAEVALFGALVFGGQGVQLTLPETPPG